MELENSLKVGMLSSLFSLNPEQQQSLAELTKAWNEMCKIWTIQKSEMGSTAQGWSLPSVIEGQIFTVAGNSQIYYFLWTKYSNL